MSETKVEGGSQLKGGGEVSAQRSRLWDSAQSSGGVSAQSSGVRVYSNIQGGGPLKVLGLGGSLLIDLRWSSAQSSGVGASLLKGPGWGGGGSLLTGASKQFRQSWCAQKNSTQSTVLRMSAVAKGLLESCSLDSNLE